MDYTPFSVQNPPNVVLQRTLTNRFKHFTMDVFLPRHAADLRIVLESYDFTDLEEEITDDIKQFASTFTISRCVVSHGYPRC